MPYLVKSCKACLRDTCTSNESHTAMNSSLDTSPVGLPPSCTLPPESASLKRCTSSWREPSKGFLKRESASFMSPSRRSSVPAAARVAPGGGRPFFSRLSFASYSTSLRLRGFLPSLGMPLIASDQNAGRSAFTSGLILSARAFCASMASRLRISLRRSAPDSGPKSLRLLTGAVPGREGTPLPEAATAVAGRPLIAVCGAAVAGHARRGRPAERRRRRPRRCDRRVNARRDADTGTLARRQQAVEPGLDTPPPSPALPSRPRRRARRPPGQAAASAAVRTVFARSPAPRGTRARACTSSPPHPVAVHPSLAPPRSPRTPRPARCRWPRPARLAAAGRSTSASSRGDGRQDRGLDKRRRRSVPRSPTHTAAGRGGGGTGAAGARARGNAPKQTLLFAMDFISFQKGNGPKKGERGDTRTRRRRSTSQHAMRDALFFARCFPLFSSGKRACKNENERRAPRLRRPVCVRSPRDRP